MGKYYAVTVGKNPRVYSSWIEAAANIRNIPGGAIYQSFSSEEEAIRAFNAAMARGEVKAYPNVKSDLDESFDDAPLSPLGGEAALLRTPADVKFEEDAVQTPMHSRVAQLRRTLRTDSSPTSSSPATHVTQVNASFVDDVRCSTPVARRHPHLTFDPSSSRAYTSISGACTQVQLDVSDGSSLFVPTTPKRMRLHPESPSKREGVKYRSLSDLEEMESLDSRIWVQKSPIFSPDNVKRWPKSRSPSPTKRNAPLPSDEAVLVDAPFVRTGRGRHSRLTPTMSLPLPNRELEDDCALIESRPTQAQESPRVRARDIGCSLSDNLPARRKIYVESHAQTVPSGDGESNIKVHCSASCAHAGFDHVPPRSIALDLDVRSPISKGTLVPINAAEALFGHPSPQFHSCNA